MFSPELTPVLSQFCTNRIWQYVLLTAVDLPTWHGWNSWGSHFGFACCWSHPRGVQCHRPRNSCASECCWQSIFFIKYPPLLDSVILTSSSWTVQIVCVAGHQVCCSRSPHIVRGPGWALQSSQGIIHWSMPSFLVAITFLGPQIWTSASDAVSNRLIPVFCIL